MSNNDGNQGNQQQGKEVKVTVTGDPEGMKTLLETQKRLEAEKKALEDQMKAIEEAKKKAEDDAKKATEENKDLNEKLGFIAQKEFEKKKGEILGKVKALIPDEARYKEIEAKLTDAEQLQATEYMVKVLDEAIKKGEESHKKLLEEEQKKAKDLEEKLAKGGQSPPAGNAPLNSAQQTGTISTGTKYSSYEAMIADLRKKEHSPNPEIAAMAKNAITELTRKWAMAVKVEAKEMREFTAEPKDQLSLADIVKHERARRQSLLNEEEGNK